MRYTVFLILLMSSSYALSSHYLATSQTHVKNYFKAIKSVESSLGKNLTPVFKDQNKLYSFWKNRKCYLVSTDKNGAVSRTKYSCRKVSEIQPKIKSFENVKRTTFSGVLKSIQSKSIVSIHDVIKTRRFNARKDMIDMDRKVIGDYEFSYHNLELKSVFNIDLIKKDGKLILVSKIKYFEDHNFWLPKKELSYVQKAYLDKNSVIFEDQDQIIIFLIPQRYNLLSQYYYKNVFEEEYEQYFYNYKDNRYCFWDYSFVKNPFDCMKIFKQKISQMSIQVLRAVVISKHNDEVQVLTDGLNQ